VRPPVSFLLILSVLTGCSQRDNVLVPPSVAIDVPAPGAALNGTLAISGWALESIALVGAGAVSSVTVLVDGNRLGSAAYGNPRPDVCAAYPARLGCPNVGWSYTLNASALSKGSHTLKIVATDTTGIEGTSEVPFIAGIQPSVVIDVPAPDAKLSGTASISGWVIENINAIGPNAVRSVDVTVDGTQVGTADYGGARPDVCASYPGRLGCPNVGWSFRLNVSALTSGSHTLNIAATDTAGNTGSKQVTFLK
jgi:hypothetical protein